MSKFYGKIGFGIQVETAQDVWEEKIVERNYYGDITRNVNKRENGEGLNIDLNLANNFSILADPFAVNNCASMLYLEYLGSKWKITSVEIQYPRLVLSVGGVYNAP